MTRTLTFVLAAALAAASACGSDSTPGGSSGEDVAGRDQDAPGGDVSVPDADAGPTGDLPEGAEVSEPADVETDAGPLPTGCCLTDADCPLTAGPPHVCVHAGAGPFEDAGVCVPPYEDDARCWRDDQCAEGERCHGALPCPCGVDCDDEHPGVCVGGTPTCSSVDPGLVEEVCDAASVVVFDGESCVTTCPGCCGCEPFCDLTFASVEACEAACTGPCPEPSPYVTSLATCAFDLADPDPGSRCPETTCRDQPCAEDSDCEAGVCVTGSCVSCWQDAQCEEGYRCRGGRCVPAEPGGCPPYPQCSAEGCRLVYPSEVPCPVCVCDPPFDKTCTQDDACLLDSSHPYQRCVYGRCAECRVDADCPGDQPCLPPGLCFGMDPHPQALYGTWLVGWAGGMDHFSYLRFEPDGTLRRGSYPATGAWADDQPPPPCAVEGDLPSPLLGTWHPEETASGLLVVRLSLNYPCADDAGFADRWRWSFEDGGEAANITSVDGPGVAVMAVRVPPETCADDMSACETPTGY